MGSGVKKLAVRREDARAIGGGYHLSGHGAKLVPELVNLRTGGTARQVMDTGIERIPLAFPGSALAARQGMHFEYLGIVTVHLVGACSG